MARSLCHEATSLHNDHSSWNILRKCLTKAPALLFFYWSVIHSCDSVLRTHARNKKLLVLLSNTGQHLNTFPVSNYSMLSVTNNQESMLFQLSIQKCVLYFSSVFFQPSRPPLKTGQKCVKNSNILNEYSRADCAYYSKQRLF